MSVVVAASVEVVVVQLYIYYSDIAHNHLHSIFAQHGGGSRGSSSSSSTGGIGSASGGDSSGMGGGGTTVYLLQ